MSSIREKCANIQTVLDKILFEDRYEEYSFEVKRGDEHDE